MWLFEGRVTLLKGQLLEHVSAATISMRSADQSPGRDSEMIEMMRRLRLMWIELSRSGLNVLR